MVKRALVLPVWLLAVLILVSGGVSQPVSGTRGVESIAYVNAVPEGYWLRTYLGVTVAVGQFHYFRDTRLFSAPAGSRFVGFGISIRNRNDSIIRVSPATVTLLDHTGHEYRHDRATFDYWLVPLQSLNATPNLLISGGMVFLIPEDSSPAQVTYDARPFGPIVTVDLAGPPIPY